MLPNLYRRILTNSTIRDNMEDVDSKDKRIRNIRRVLWINALNNLHHFNIAKRVIFIIT